LLRSGARFAEKAMVLGALDDDTAARIATRRIGPALVFERLWEETGGACPRRPEIRQKSQRKCLLRRICGRLRPWLIRPWFGFYICC
ncbi:MAG: hypothetical protein WBV90_07310, partial [Terrimicrobiaceae bacterium]